LSILFGDSTILREGLKWNAPILEIEIEEPSLNLKTRSGSHSGLDKSI
jgi:hypothetical protein